MSDNLPRNLGFNHGWICPQCNAVMSPTFPSCFYCKPKQMEKVEHVDAGFNAIKIAIKIVRENECKFMALGYKYDKHNPFESIVQSLGQLIYK